MGFGVIIASGENNTLLRDDLVDGITEVRVEQFLDTTRRCSPSAFRKTL
jgi:hypothetical protein